MQVFEQYEHHVGQACTARECCIIAAVTFVQHRAAALPLQVGNTWRTTQDISYAIQATWDSVLNNLDGSVGLARFAGPGGWNDLDLMEVRRTLLLCAASHAGFSFGDAAVPVMQGFMYGKLCTAAKACFLATRSWAGQEGSCSQMWSSVRTLGCGPY